ncbi:hypothetical protein PBY51_010956 [Eleginops maclovinus]|uniref:Uncharacterized protein n=1 Tax=Eleginops maclovinus TaxID=56733 RepID=A0AAN7X4X4_ELEMC|nr:hypothetical protein PBY51_010956 [Eleginops maclovinus]
MMGLFLLSSFPDPPTTTSIQPSQFPKRLAFLGATSEAALEGRPARSWVAPCARAPRGGDNVLLIDWASWAECRNLQEGETEKMGMRDGGGGTSREDSQPPSQIH